MAGKKARRERRLQRRQEQLALQKCRPRLPAEERAKKRRERFGTYTRARPTRMSEIIWHVGQPLIDEFAKTPEHVRRIIGLVIAAWNLMLLPEEERKEFQTKLVYDLFGRKAYGVVPLGPSREEEAMFQWICNIVAERKEELYPRMHRWIADFSIEVDESDVRLNVVSILKAPEE